MDTLLGLLGSSWDRTRSLAYSTLSRFPCPLAGYEGTEGAKRLAVEGLRLSGSGRQQESDRGALILRLVFVSHARGLGLDVPLFAAEIGDRGGCGDGGSESKEGQGLRRVGMTDTSHRHTGGQEEGGADSAVCFLEGLRAVLSHRLGSGLFFVMVWVLSVFGRVDRLGLGAPRSALLRASANSGVDALASMYIDVLMN